MRIRSDFISLPVESGQIPAAALVRARRSPRSLHSLRPYSPIVTGSRTLRWARSHFSRGRPGLHWFQRRTALRRTKRCDSPESWRSRP
ncbi:hypothetical protein P355_0398 [Burkholderia cenocepacia KC-01]|nr:hypothetical protein P355_0398 [Burkholderia cenocepacia KC-01]